MPELRFEAAPAGPVHISLPPSKSLSNRYLVLQALCREPVEIKNLSPARDCRLLQDALSAQKEIDLQDAGTPLRFMIAVTAARGSKLLLTGNDSLKRRPVGPLVEALAKSGARFAWKGEPGHAPLQLEQPMHEFGDMHIDQGQSSQFVSALALIAPLFPGEKRIKLHGEAVSRPYVELSRYALAQFRVQTHLGEKALLIHPGELKAPAVPLVVESDWSAAAFFFGLCACLPGTELRFAHLPQETVQGDARVVEIYRHLGVIANIEFPDGLHIHHSGDAQNNTLHADMKDCPDMAPALVCTCALLGLPAVFRGMDKLQLKESDRLQVMQDNLAKFHISFARMGDTWALDPGQAKFTTQTIETASDHRMAMAFALFALKCPIQIDDMDCVEKSFPGFWEEWAKCGFTL